MSHCQTHADVSLGALGMADLIWICTVIWYLIVRSEDIITAAITIAVVLVVAAVSSGPAWLQPILRLVDTVVGIVVGFLASRLCFVFGHSQRFTSLRTDTPTLEGRGA